MPGLPAHLYALRFPGRGPGKLDIDGVNVSRPEVSARSTARPHGLRASAMLALDKISCSAGHIGYGAAMAKTSSVDRAFDLAKSGHYRSVSEIMRRLPAEDRAAVEAHLAVPAARRALILICSDAWLSADGNL